MINSVSRFVQMFCYRGRNNYGEDEKDRKKEAEKEKEKEKEKKKIEKERSFKIMN